MWNWTVITTMTPSLKETCEEPCRVVQFHSKYLYNFGINTICLVFNRTRKRILRDLFLNYWRELEPKNWVVLIYTNCLNRLIKRELKSFLILYKYYTNIFTNSQVNQCLYHWSFLGYWTERELKSFFILYLYHTKTRLKSQSWQCLYLWSFQRIA